jgi:hypothetical protein
MSLPLRLNVGLIAKHPPSFPKARNKVGLLLCSFQGGGKEEIKVGSEIRQNWVSGSSARVSGSSVGFQEVIFGN